MSEVVGCPVCCVDHVCLLEYVVGGGVQGLCPDVFRVGGIIGEAQPVASPVPNDRAEGVVVDGVFLVLTSHSAVAVHSLAEPSPCVPSAEYGVPAREADPGCHVFRYAFDVVDASSGVDAWPA